MLGWGKSSKCKKLLKQVRTRLECLIEERCAITTLLRHNVEKLDYEALKLRIQHEERIRDESSVYNFLDHFCEYILMHFFYIQTHKQCRQRDLAEAISSLVFASSRLRGGVVRKLEEIRDLFRERYGESFIETAVKLLPGNLVNPIFQKTILSLFPDSVVPNHDTVKHELVKPSITSSSPDELPDTSSAEKKEDESRNNQLQLISLESPFHVHPKLPDWDYIFTKFSAIKRPKYVHPKLPEYDDIAAKFDALKSLNNVSTTEILQLEYYSDHDIIDVDDQELFKSSGLPIEPAPLLLLTC